jgi:hypothetical protein
VHTYSSVTLMDVNGCQNKHRVERIGDNLLGCSVGTRKHERASGGVLPASAAKCEVSLRRIPQNSWREGGKEEGRNEEEKSLS